MIVVSRKRLAFLTYCFANQCSILNNSIIIPQIDYKINKRIRYIIVLPLANIITNLNANKTHGHDNISIKMIEICGDTNIAPLILIFESVIKLGNFPE